MNNNFASNFRFLRQQKGLSQKAIAEFFGMSATTVNRWEKDAIFPESSNLLKLAEYFEVSLTELVELDLMKGESAPKSSNEETSKLQAELLEVLRENRELRKELMNSKR